MNTYTWFRKIHLYSGLTIVTFLVMYFVTGYPLSHEHRFPQWDYSEKTRTEPLTYPGRQDEETFSNYLQATFDLRGQPSPPKRLPDGSWQFRFIRPGTFHQAVVAPSGDRVQITTRNAGFFKTLAGFHKLKGYRGNIFYHVWAILYDLASLSLIVFGFSGVYLWYRLTKERLLGWICLGASFTYATVTVLYCLYAP